MHAHVLQAKINSRGFGILDIKFVNDNLGYACGGSGSLFKTGERQHRRPGHPSQGAEAPWRAA